MRRLLSALFLPLIATALSGAVMAQEKDDGPLLSDMKAFLVTLDDEGKEVKTPATEAEPEQIIEYILTYTNVGKGPLRELKINGPIPENTGYVADSAKTKVDHDFRVSIDGGKTWDKEPVKRVRVAADGSKREVIVPPSEYTNTRWIVQQALEPKTEMQFFYRVKVD